MAAVVLCLLLMVGGIAAPALTVLALAGMLPTAVAWMIDRYRPRYLAMAVAMTNFAGVLPILLMQKAGAGLDTVERVMADPFAWLAMYGGAGVGWLLLAVAPAFSRAMLQANTAMQHERLRRVAALLRQEWGIEEPPARK
jgi:hypothetical protein